MNDINHRIRDIEYYEILEKKVRDLNRDKQKFAHEIFNLQSNLQNTNEAMSKLEKMVKIFIFCFFFNCFFIEESKFK